MRKFWRQLGVSLFHRHEAHPGDVPILTVKDLSVLYDGQTALDHVSFTLRPGERVAVVGPNGAGKSTLFKSLAGLIHPSSGEVRVFDNDPGSHICVGYVPQRSQVDWDFPVNVHDVVMMGRTGKIGFLKRAGREDHDKVHAALERVRMLEYSGRRINQLSGGQQQRVFIARCLAQEAELLLMDEPFAGLDVNSRKEILAILHELEHDGVPMLVSLHDLETAASQFSKVMLLNRKIFGIGTPAEVLHRDNLLEAYGAHLHLSEGDGDLLAFHDSFCEGGEK